MTKIRAKRRENFNTLLEAEDRSKNWQDKSMNGEKD